MISIKDISGNTRFSTIINEGSKRKFLLMKEDYITVKFNLEEPIFFKLGDYVDDSQIGLFEICDLQKPTYNTSTAGYEYELRLDAYYWKWKNKIFKFTPEVGGQEASWNLTASLDTQLGVFLRNLQALSYTYRGKSFEFSIDSSVENKALLMSYDNTNMIDALSQMAEKWECEWWVTENIIHFGRCEFGDPVDFEIGVNVEEMTRSDSQTDYATRIYAFGSTRNIPANYRPVDETVVVNGVVQKRLMLPAGTPYIDAYEGMTQEEAIEQVVVFDDIYPRRVGTMSDITTHEYTDTIENEDGTTTQKQWNAYRFKDTGVTFSKDYVLSGEELHIIFQSGVLNGMDFAVTFNPESKDEKNADGTWNPEAQLWEIVRNEDYGRELPGDVLVPKAGDTYTLYGWDSTKIAELGLISAAELELKEKTEAYRDKSKIDPSTYTNKMMSDCMVYVNGSPKLLEAGDRVNLVNAAYFESGSRASRVIGFEYNLDIPYDSPIYTVGETASYSRIGDLEGKVESLTLQGQVYTGGGGSGIYVIGVNDKTVPSSRNVFSALRSRLEHISKLFNDTVMGVLTFLQLQYFRAGAIFGKDGFLDGLAGFGAKIGADGRAIMRALTLWEWLEVPELRYNRVDIYTGIGWRVPGGGIVESVDVDTDASGNPLSTGTVHLKLEKGEIGAVSLDDISLAIYHYENDSLNASADSDDSRGNFSFAGFGTSYFRITEVLGKKNASFRYSLRPGYSLHPQPQMHFSCYGNFTNKDRQTSVYATRTYTRMLWKQNTWEIGVGNIAKQSGDLSNLNIHGLNLEGYSEYCNSVYFTGTVTQIKPDGTPVRTANDRMAWSEGHYDYYDRVSHNGRIWLCVNENGTTSEPAEGNADWLNEVDKGADGDSVSFKGQWRTGLHVPYLGIVRMGTSSWMCNVRGGTDNPPMWCYTDHAGNRLAYSDGGYVLTGETNTAEYVLVATDGLQGLQGTNGQDGIPGTPGKDGATTYFHIKYAPVSNPTAEQMSEEPDVYIGTYVDFVKEDSDVPSSYSWARFQGLQGAKGEQGIPGIGVDGKTYYLHIKYSNDGGRTFTGNNGEDTGAYIGVLTDLNVNDSNTPGDYKWSLIKGDKGDQGDSVSNKGQWRTGLHVPYLGIVRMGTSSWMCNVRGGTDNPPMWCYTDHAGNRLAYSDGGYVLTGETNTAEYVLVATDGGNGTDGSDGKNGLQGIQGCIIRRGEWSIGTEWRNDEAATSGTRFLDVALVRDNGVATGWRAYKCKVTHTGSTGNAPGNTTYWEEFSLNTTAIFTSLIIAKDAQIEFMQGNQLLIKKEDGKVTAGLSGSQSGDKVRIWAGGEIPDTARFRVYETGDTYTGGDSIFDGYIKNTGVYAHESRNTSLGSGRYLVDKDLKLYSCSGRAYGETGIEDEVFILPSDSEFIGTIINISNLCFPPYTRVVGAIRYTTVARPGGGTRNADRIHGYPIPLTDTNFVDMAADILSVSFISGFIELMGVPESDGSCGWIVKQINALRQNYVKLEQ